MQRFDIDGRDVVESEEADPVSCAFDLGLWFCEDVAAGTAPVRALGTEEHGYGAEIGSEVAGGVILLGTLRWVCGSGVSFCAELVDDIGVGNWGGEAEAFFQGEALAHHGEFLGRFPTVAGDIGVEGHYAGERAGGRVVDIARRCEEWVVWVRVAELGFEEGFEIGKDDVWVIGSR